MKLEEIDKNMAVPKVVSKDGFEFYNIDYAPFRIYGIYKENGSYRRISDKVAKRVNIGVFELSAHTAGGRVRFVTNSERLSFSVKRKPASSGYALYNSAGFDVYADGEYWDTVRLSGANVDSYDYITRKITYPQKDRVVTVNFPNYGSIDEVLVGIEEGATLLEAPDYKYETPAVFYGSSITQGGCASRPGMSYESILSRKLDLNYINLGFSGNALGEDSMAEYIADLDMSVFVYDYDFNAPTPEHLKATHEKMFLKIREKNPELPIIMLTRPQYTIDEWSEEPKKIIMETYNNAVSRGDKNVYYICGKDLFEPIGNDGTVDGCHPTDLGFWFMAQGILPTLKKIIEK